MHVIVKRTNDVVFVDIRAGQQTRSADVKTEGGQFIENKYGALIFTTEWQQFQQDLIHATASAQIILDEVDDEHYDDTDALSILRDLITSRVLQRPSRDDL